MKLNISYPLTGGQKSIEIDDDNKLRPFFDRRMGAEVEGDSLGDEFKGYVFKISGGNDKQGFPMMQGIMSQSRVRLLLKKGSKCYRPRRTGERKRKSVRGCIVSHDLSILNLVVVQKGEGELEGITNVDRPRRLGPKRASKIRKLFNLDADDDVRKYVVRRQVGKKSKAPKIQRLVTKDRLRRKANYLKSLDERGQRAAAAKAKYEQVVKEYRAQVKDQKMNDLAKKKKTTA